MLAGHGPTKIHLAKEACGYFTLSPPLPLHVPSLSLPPFTPTMERIWKINCVSLNVICLLLLPEFLYLPPCSCLSILSLPFFFSSLLRLSLCLHLVSITAPLSIFDLSPVKYAGRTALFWETAWGYYIPPPPIVSFIHSLFPNIVYILLNMA